MRCEICERPESVDFDTELVVVRQQEYTLLTLDLCQRCDEELTVRLFEPGSAYFESAVLERSCPGPAAYAMRADVVTLAQTIDLVQKVSRELYHAKYAGLLQLLKVRDEMKERLRDE